MPVRLNRKSGALSPLFICMVIFFAIEFAHAQGGWRLVRTEEFQSPVYNSAAAPTNMRDPYCSQHTIDIGPGRDTRAFSIKEVIPGNCHNRAGSRGVQAFSHQWTNPPAVLPAGQVMPFTLSSKVVTVENISNGRGSSGVYAGFLDYNQPNGPYGPGSNEPTYKIATVVAEGPANAGMVFNNERAEKPFIMPPHPWMGSDRNNGQVRFRIWTTHVAPWRAVDYIYKWDPSVSTGAAQSTANSSAWPGQIWKVRESAPDGRYCDGTWTRIGNTNRFSGEWTCSWGANVKDNLTIHPLKGNQVTVLRESLGENYRGTLSVDGSTIDGTTWGAGGKWKVQIQK